MWNINLNRCNDIFKGFRSNIGVIGSIRACYRIFSEFGKLTIAFFFIAINAVGLMLLGVNEEAFRMELDIILGSFIFVYAPTVSINKLFVRTNEAEEYIARLVFSRLDFMTNSLMSVRKNAESIAKMLNKKKIKNDIGNEVCERVCSKCRNKLICWENNYEKTNESFNRMAKREISAFQQLQRNWKTV